MVPLCSGARHRRFSRSGAIWLTGKPVPPKGVYDPRLVYTKGYEPGTGLSNTAALRSSKMVTITLNNDQFTVDPAPSAAVNTAFTLDLVINGGGCHIYSQEPDAFTWHARAVHDSFWQWTLDLQPATHTHGTEPAPHGRNYGSITGTGDGNAPWGVERL